MIRNNFRMKKVYLLFLLFPLISGCSVWYDFTAYFNLYYNASLAFEQAEEAIKLQKTDNLSMLEPQVPQSANGLLNKVIEKCSKILQFDSESSFVDDALFMIGKSFYYQKVYIKALRKFEELAAMGNDTDLLDEADLWRAKTYFQQKNYTEALAILTRLKAKALAEEDDDLAAAVNFEELKYLISIEKYDEAYKAAANLIKFSSDPVLNAEVLYKIGDIYYNRNDFKNAAESFRRVVDYSPAYEFEINSQIRYSVALRKMDKAVDAVRNLLELRSEAKYSDKYDYIDLELGKSYSSLGQYQRALTLYYESDTAYTNSVYLGNMRYELATLYEEYYLLYDSAVVYYNKALSSQATADYLPNIRAKAELFNKYVALRNALNTGEKNYLWASDSAAFIRDSLLYAESIDTTQQEGGGPAEPKDAPRNRDRNFDPELQQNTPVTTTTAPKNKGVPPVRPVLTADSLRTVMIKAKVDLANLFYTDFDHVDSAYIHYSEIDSGFPENQYSPQVLYSLAGCYLTYGDSLTADSLYKVIYDRYPNLQIANVAALKLKLPLRNLNFDPAEDKYIEAEQLVLNKEFKKAIGKMLQIPKEFPLSPFAPKSLYTGGYIWEKHLKQNDSAVVVYDSLIAKYPSSVYASKIHSSVRFYHDEKTRIQNEIRDSLAKIREKFVQDSIAKSGVNKPDSLKLKTNADSLKQKSVLDSLQQKSKMDSLLLKEKEIDPDSGEKQEIELNNEKEEEQKEELPRQFAAVFRKSGLPAIRYISLQTLPIGYV